MSTLSVASDERPPTTKGPTPLQLRRVAATLLGGGAAAVVMLVVGWAFDQLEYQLPAIKAEYDNKAVFRTWPGWTETYMRAHPCWFGFVFAFVYVLLSQGDLPAGRGRAAGAGALYGAVVFLVGSLPIFALIYASFQVSLGLLALSWVARNLAQYVIAGAVLGLVVRACRTAIWPLKSRGRTPES
jgi:hypothetical protein